MVVLPFFNHSQAANLDWIGESIAESLHDSLFSGGLLVLDRADRLEGYRRLSLRPGAELTRASIMKVGEALDASRVIYGDYQVTAAEAGGTSKGSIRITARVIDRKHSRQSAPFSESGSLEDLAALQVHLGWQALESLNPKTAPSEQVLRGRPPVRLDAVESSCAGCWQPIPSSGTVSLRRRRGWTALFSALFSVGQELWEKKGLQGGRRLAGAREPVDARYLEAQFFLGLCRYYEWRFPGCGRSFQLVASSVPLNEVLNNLGAALGPPQ